MCPLHRLHNKLSNHALDSTDFRDNVRTNYFRDNSVDTEQLSFCEEEAKKMVRSRRQQAIIIWLFVRWDCYSVLYMYTDKKENKIFLIYKKIQMELGAKSYMRKGFLIYEEMHKYFHHI
jgi:hypothetical protein